MMLEQVRRRADEFDVLHFHIDYLHFPLVHDFIERTITTLHGRLDLPDLKPLFAAFPGVRFVSIWRDQRRPLPRRLNWAGTVHHGLPKDLLPFRRVPTGGYLAFLGRVSPEKRPDRAIEIAPRAGLPLKMAAKIDAVDRAYWDDKVAPLVARHPNVEFVGEINDRQKAEFLGNAQALLLPIDWPEPFGLVMIEAMVCGTPVVAFRSCRCPSSSMTASAGSSFEPSTRPSPRCVAYPIGTAAWSAPRSRVASRPNGRTKALSMDISPLIPLFRSLALLDCGREFPAGAPDALVEAWRLLRRLRPDRRRGRRSGQSRRLLRPGARYLSTYLLTIEGKRPLVLSSTLRDDNATLTCDLTNPDLYDSVGALCSSTTASTSAARGACGKSPASSG